MKDNRRLVKILQFLHENTDEEHAETTATILEFLESQGMKVDRKTLGKDMEILINMNLGIGKEKSSPNKYFWRKRLFKTAELKFMSDAVLSSKSIPKEKSRELIDKLTKLTSVHEAKLVANGVNYINRPKSDNMEIFHTINMINDAIENHSVIGFKYTTYDRYKKKIRKDKGREYYLSPYRMIWNDNNYYVIGWSRKHKSVSVFRIDRMEETQVKKRSYYVEQPADFDLDDFADKQFAMFVGDKVKVALEVRNDLMKYIIEKFGIDVVTDIPMINGRSDIFGNTFIAWPEVGLSPTFYSWVFQFNGDIRIMAPEEAVKGFEDMLDRIKAGYTAHEEEQDAPQDVELSQDSDFDAPQDVELSQDSELDAPQSEPAEEDTL